MPHYGFAVIRHVNVVCKEAARVLNTGRIVTNPAPHQHVLCRHFDTSRIAELAVSVSAPGAHTRGLYFPSCRITVARSK